MDYFCTHIVRFIYVFTFLLAGCISEIDFPVEGTPRISIGGVLTNSPGERTINVQLTSGFDSLATPLSAQAFLLRDGQIRGDFQEIEPGVLRLPEGEVILPGFNYQVQINTQDGKEFISRPQIVQEPFPVDSLTFDIVPGTVEELDGSITPTNIARVFAHLTLPPTGLENLFFKWQIESSWIFNDLRGVSCYIQDPLSTYPISLARGLDVGAGNARVLIATRELGDPFLVETYFSSFLHMVDKEGFEFYRAATRLTGNQGTIFDEIPGFIEGNVEEVGGEGAKESILGYIEFALSDTTRLLIQRGDFTFQLFDSCAGGCPPAGEGPPRPCVCSDCGAFFGRNSEIRPSYW